MNVKKLAHSAAVMLQDQYLIQLLEDEETGGSEQCAAQMLMAVNDAASELSTSFPVYRTIIIESVGKFIPRSAIAGEGRLDVVSVTVGGEPIPYTVDHDGIRLDGVYGGCAVTYSPEVYDLEMDDDFVVAKEVSYLMAVYLVARNYCMTSGRMDEATMYDSRYNDCAETLRLKRRARMPARKFV